MKKARIDNGGRERGKNSGEEEKAGDSEGKREKDI